MMRLDKSLADCAIALFKIEVTSLTPISVMLLCQGGCPCIALDALMQSIPASLSEPLV